MTSTTPSSTGGSLSLPAGSRLKSELRDLLSEKERRQHRTRFLAYRPYARQAAFHEAGAVARERLFMAGNQLGKTMAGAAEMAIHLTGRYPDWWRGRRFARPIAALAGSETAELTRQGVQRLLLGPPADEEEWGTGLIPGDDILEVTRRRGVADAVDTIVAATFRAGIRPSASRATIRAARNGWPIRCISCGSGSRASRSIGPVCRRSTLATTLTTDAIEALLRVLMNVYVAPPA